MSVLKISKEGQLLWTSLLLVWPKSQRKETQRYRLNDWKGPFAREGCAGQCATVFFRQFMELLLPHLLMNGTAVSFKHRQCAANSLLIGVIVRTVQMASEFSVCQLAFQSNIVVWRLFAVADTGADLWWSMLFLPECQWH